MVLYQIPLHCSHWRCGEAQWAQSTAGFVQLDHRAMCSVRRIVPELISFDDLRDKFLSRVEVPRGPLRKLSRNFKGSRLSAQLLLVGWMVLIQKITTKTLRIQFGITMLLSSVTFSRMQEKTAGKADKGETWFSRRHPMAARKRCKKNVFSSTFCPLLPSRARSLQIITS